MQRYFDKGMWAVVGLLFALTVANALVAYHNIRDLYEARVLVGQSRQFQGTLQQVLSTALDAETAVRGYVITGEARYLEPYKSALAAIDKLLPRLSQLAEDSPRQAANIADARLRVHDHFFELDYILATAGQQGFAAARDRILMDRSKQRMDELRTEIAEMGELEAEVLDARARASVRSMDMARGSAAFAALLGVVMIVALVYQMRRNLVSRDVAAAVLGEQKELFRTTLASLADAVVTCNTAGRVTFINGAGEALTHWSADKAVGLPIEDVVRVVDEHTHEPIENSAQRALREGVPVRNAHRGKLVARGGGLESPVEDGASPILDSDGRIAGAVLVFRDITERKRSEDALMDAAQRKDEFLAVLAHELRNPLAPLRNALEIVRLSGSERAPVEHVWAIMERQVRQMVRLIDDLLDISRITRNKIELRREPLDLREVVEAALEISSPIVARYGHRVDVTLPQRPAAIDGDRVRLTQVVDNLVTNAAKYTEPGGRISIGVEPSAGELVIRVKDNGIGIPPEMLERVFEMFTQVDRSLERSRGGLGIGLTLVRRLVELHGGTVVAHSEGSGRGSELVVRLPALAEMPMVPAAPQIEGAVQGERRRVLVTDDNHDSAESMARMLAMLGHEVRTAFDGEECLRTCDEFRPEVVLLDIGMPKLNGYDAAQRIRAQPYGDEVLLIAMTGWGQAEDRARARMAGFDRHLVKPVDIAEVTRLLREPNTESEAAYAGG